MVTLACNTRWITVLILSCIIPIEKDANFIRKCIRFCETFVESSSLTPSKFVPQKTIFLLKKHKNGAYSIPFCFYNFYRIVIHSLCIFMKRFCGQEKIFSFSHKTFLIKKNQPMSIKKQTTSGLQFSRHFTREDVAPFDMFEYELRTSVIKNTTGEIVFQMDDVEVPKQWSQIATDILAQKYFRKAGVPQPDGSTGRENSIKQVAHRMAHCWRMWGERNGYFATQKDSQIFYDELIYAILNQACVPNSPQWFNTGLHEVYGITGKPQGHYYVDEKDGVLKKSTSAYERPQPHACFILSVNDDLVNDGGIMDLWVREARIFKYGSGVGTNFSNIRGEGEKLSGGGTSSGLMSFLKIGDRAAGAIKSGGTTRRAAKMVCLDIDHPEIESFINWKVEEENKVAALIAAGYPSDYEGEAYKTVSGQNSNNSVRISNEFFHALETGGDWQLKARSDGHTMKTIKAKKLWDEITYAAWRCADPGTQYDSTINEWHTCPEGGRINASNPCSEYMFLDNTACNLASVNLRKFFNEENNSFDVPGFEYTVRLWTTVLEISVLMAQFPSKEVAQLSYDYRTLGLGFANLGSLLMVSGIAYDSDQARGIAGAITAIMTGIAYKTSAELAQHLGTFKRFPENKKHMLRVMHNHRAAAYDAMEAYEGIEIKPQGINAKYCPDYLLKAATKAWDEAVMLGEKFGYRNAQTTVIAPTGTIGLVMDCDTTGVEPDFALVKFKKLSGGGYFKIINQSVPQALRNLKYTEDEVEEIVNYAKGHATLENAPHINFESLSEKGFTAADIQKIETALPSAFEIGFVFNAFNLGEDCLNRLGFKAEDYKNYKWSLLEALGFTDAEIEEANTYICGTMTVEGAPYLKKEHLPVFDCANKCGSIGERFIHYSGHIRMMAAAQPFLSGAISKTINLPNEGTVEEIADAYLLSWKLGLKACALYRDGSKLSQPLSNKSDKKKKTKVENEAEVTEEQHESALINMGQLTVEDLLFEVNKRVQNSADTSLKRQLAMIVERRTLPPKRRGFTQKAKINGQTLFLRTGEYSDGTLGEIFIDMAKEGATVRSMLNCFAIAISIGLQYGVPLEEFVEKFIFTRFEPSGIVEHPNIKTTTSIIDFMFRSLAYEYLGRNDLVHVLDKPESQNSDTGEWDANTPTIGERVPELSDIRVTAAANANPHTQPPHRAEHVKKANLDLDAVNLAAKNMQGDAPACNICGHITIRNGTCYKCLNCGNSMGCS
jgi:ribonucleoside-diphosphate reductase alpha chain